LVRRSAKDESHLFLPDDDDDDFDTLVGDEIMLVAVITAASDASTFCSPEQEERWGRFKLERGGDIICDDE
jgi:hypothetical protein